MARTKTWENIDLFGRNFEFNTKETVGYAPIYYQTVDDVYDRPSETKRAIFKEWDSWFNANNGYCTVASYNSNFFTLEGYVKNYDTREMWYCYITHAHNKCYKVAWDEG